MTVYLPDSHQLTNHRLKTLWGLTSPSEDTQDHMIQKSHTKLIHTNVRTNREEATVRREYIKKSFMMSTLVVQRNKNLEAKFSFLLSLVTFSLVKTLVLHFKSFYCWQ